MLFEGSRAQLPLSLKERRAFRNLTAKLEAPKIAGFMSAVALVMVVLNSSIGAYAGFAENLPVTIVALLMAAVAASVGRPWVPPGVVPWITATLAVLLVGALAYQESAYQSPTGLAYALLVIVAFGPVTLNYLAAGVAVVPIAVMCVVAAGRFVEDAVIEWILVLAAAVLIDVVLMWMRVASIDALASSIAHERAISTEDSLTGLLNRRGLEARTGQLLAWSQRHGVRILTMFVDINGLKEANDAYGHDYGDQVIKATGDAIRAVVRADDLVGRWGGDEFVVLCLGSDWEADSMKTRIEEWIAASTADRSRWPGTVTVGAATSDAGYGTFAELVRAADEDMYLRRFQARG
ncbi:MAG: GGDEF domain-containing protein [Candidatus Nanopelagicales bacterium]